MNKTDIEMIQEAYTTILEAAPEVDLNGLRGKVIGTVAKSPNTVIVLCQDGTQLTITGTTLNVKVENNQEIVQFNKIGLNR